MELPELSLAPTQAQLVFKKSISGSNNPLESAESNTSRKRKLFQDHQLLKTEASFQTSVDLQLKDPLPLDWEQCLDLESGKMYYLNRKTSRKSWNWPMDQAVNLELNISTISGSSSDQRSSPSLKTIEEAKNEEQQSNMVALACFNCHLLVILSKSSPACPNCKYVHSLPTSIQPNYNSS
ncbi:unnamed protein product [Prunus armeniaca]|uniref:WW domain-containing protein n=1 Tax=Prunus armeniaca TaxID=36596 RepID=A0A6J5W2M8_PRUAR|nr:unnamed protein product [Prunus armeniaca]CAB4294242.1 unnamed protein product [Prunus armeniaca]